MRLVLCWASTALLATSSLSAQQAATDKYLWLEDVNGTRPMAWVKAENAKTSAVLEKDPRFAGIYKAILANAQTSDRIPYVSFIGDQLYNFWKDSTHLRGIWRRTTLASYRTASPQWTTVLDLDSLAKAEMANWIWSGVTCAQPDERRCLLQLSDGGEDAVTVREFDVVSRTFVKNGFYLPKGKQGAAWIHPDTLLVSREWARGDLTTSGYPYIVKRVARGQALAAAVEVFRAVKTDMGVWPGTLNDGDGHQFAAIQHAVSFFSTKSYGVQGKTVTQLGLPAKSSIVGMMSGQLIVRISEAWTSGGIAVPAGALVSIDAAAGLKAPRALVPTVIRAPGPRESIGSVEATRSALYVEITQNVRGRVAKFMRAANGSWSSTMLSLPDNATTTVAAAHTHGSTAFINVESFTTPSSLWLTDASGTTVTSIKSLPPKFDASKAVAEQFEATSTDGTKIPYFVLRPKAAKADGLNPTILEAYGGFELSNNPSYSANEGKVWIENGGVYVLANIRGGGEFGPAWHEAGLKTKRQIIYDDFVAVAKDLIARKITSPRHLGIVGGSNGGLLMGVTMTQHPELFNAVQIAVPLLDMIRYEKIAAGASWVGEYGSMSVPAERAFWESHSPYQQLSARAKYPTPFIWTTTKDDRVGPQHARKFAAKLSELGHPYLFYEVIEGGHGAGANAEQSSRTSAMGFVYFMKQLMDKTPGVVP